MSESIVEFLETSSCPSVRDSQISSDDLATDNIFATINTTNNDGYIEESVVLNELVPDNCHSTTYNTSGIASVVDSFFSGPLVGVSPIQPLESNGRKEDLSLIDHLRTTSGNTSNMLSNSLSEIPSNIQQNHISSSSSKKSPKIYFNPGPRNILHSSTPIASSPLKMSVSQEEAMKENRSGLSDADIQKSAFITRTGSDREPNQSLVEPKPVFKTVDSNIISRKSADPGAPSNTATIAASVEFKRKENEQVTKSKAKSSGMMVKYGPQLVRKTDDATVKIDPRFLSKSRLPLSFNSPIKIPQQQHSYRSSPIKPLSASPKMERNYKHISGSIPKSSTPELTQPTPNYANLLLKNRAHLSSRGGRRGGSSSSQSSSMDSPLFHRGPSYINETAHQHSNGYTKYSSPDTEQETEPEQEWSDIDENGNEVSYTDQSYYYSIVDDRDNRQQKHYDDMQNDKQSQHSPSKTQKQSHVLLNPELPIILSSYLQLLFNIAMMSLLIYSIYIFLSTVRHDVDQKVEEYSSDILAEMALCSKEYIRNNCMPGRRVPALEKTCNNWEKCMNQDPALIGRARVSAETFGEIINSFLNPIGFKSMAFLITAFAGSFIIVNYVFSYKPHSYRFKKNGSRRRERSRSESFDCSSPGGPRDQPPPTPQPFLLYAAATPGQSAHPRTPGGYFYATPHVGSRLRSPFTASARRRR